MKMINAGTAAITDHKYHSRNCNLGKCKLPYIAPVPSLADVQLYVNFGTLKPKSIVFTIIDICTYNATAALQSNCFIIANNGSYWYGVFKKLTSSAEYSSYIIALQVVYENNSTATYFSEQYTQQNDCDNLTRVQVCYPGNYNAEDINGVYVGEPDNNFSISGTATIFYQHIFWVRGAEIIETGNKITFTSNSKKNFSSKLNKTFELRTEFVPGWYKDYLLSVYFRGQFTINGVETKASELAFENILEDADLWKPTVKIDKEIKGAFGCAPVVCINDCPECVPVILPEISLPPAVKNVPYNYSVAITGTPSFAVSAVTGPLTVTVTGNTLLFSGTPTADGAFSVGATITNECGEQILLLPFTVAATGDAILTFENYSAGTFHFSLSSPVGANITITSADVLGTQASVNCTTPYEEGDSLALSSVIVAGNTSSSTSGATPMSCLIQSWKRQSSITIAGHGSLMNGGTFTVGGITVTVVIDTNCAGPYAC
jgi:hypothetical protein